MPNMPKIATVRDGAITVACATIVGALIHAIRGDIRRNAAIKEYDVRLADLEAQYPNPAATGVYPPPWEIPTPPSC